MFYFSTFKIIYCNDDKKCKNYYIYTVLFLNSNISRILTLKKQKQVASYKAVHYLTNPAYHGWQMWQIKAF